MLFIFLLALILFGPKKLPEIGREIGKFMAEFKRASNDFTSQLQAEIEKAGTDVVPQQQGGSSSSFTQTLLPPAVKSAISEIDDAHERLMRAGRMAFEAQNFTLRPPETPVVASSAPAGSTLAAEKPSASDGQPSATAEAVSVEAQAPTTVEAATTLPVPEAAPAPGNSATQSS